MRSGSYNRKLQWRTGRNNSIQFPSVIFPYILAMAFTLDTYHSIPVPAESAVAHLTRRCK